MAHSAMNRRTNLVNSTGELLRAATDKDVRQIIVNADLDNIPSVKLLAGQKLRSSRGDVYHCFADLGAFLRVLEDFRTYTGEAETPGGPFDKPDAQLRLEVGNAPAYRRNRHMQQLSGLREAVRLDHLSEDQNRIKVRIHFYLERHLRTTSFTSPFCRD